MEFCTKCGAQLPESGVCPNCAPAPAGDWQQSPMGPPPQAPPPPPGYQQPGYEQSPYHQQPAYGQSYGPPPAGGEVRSPATCIILSLVTCGIYYLYWLWVTHKQINELAGSEIVSGGMLILSWFCTPLLWYYWYKWDLALQDIAARINLRYSANFILWIILALFGVGTFVMMFQVQEALNEAYGG